ncbi:MAG TPA: SgcJ/EcaC family oxidoreductase [Holophagaceae bacterium]|nr:SgcJ/EcaC family oxidoreductase [Holophagaceae bacterium]
MSLRLAASLLTLTLCGQVPAPQTPAPPPLPASAMPAPEPAPGLSPAEAVVQRNMDAYNAHDARALSETFAPDAQFIQHPGILVFDGRDAIYKGYAEVFRKNGKAHARLVHRTYLGTRIVDEEEFTGLGKVPVHGLVIYDVRNGLIQNVWAIPPE